MIPFNPVYVHQQTIASAEWTVAHNLGFKPAFDVITVIGGLNTKTMPNNAEHVDDNTLVLTFSSAQTGSVRCA